jgi:hypothetical protein
MALEGRPRVAAARPLAEGGHLAFPREATKKVNDVTDRPKPDAFARTSAAGAGELRIYLAPGRRSRERGQLYNAHLGAADGELIVRNALDAEYAACRVLRKRGITGALTVWHVGSPHPSMYIRDIAVAARLTLREDRHYGPTVRKYRRIFE